MADKCEPYVRGYSAFCNGGRETEVTTKFGRKASKVTVDVKVVVDRERVRMKAAQFGAAEFGEAGQQWLVSCTARLNPGNQYQLAVKVSGSQPAPSTRTGEPAAQQALRRAAFVLVSAQIERCAEVRASLDHMYKANWPEA